MTSNFQDRLAQAERLEVPFIKTFNDKCHTHRIFKFGIESTELRGLHEYIRYATDPTSHFIRYLPDSALVRIDGNVANQRATLLEFKLHDTLISTDGLFDRIHRSHLKLNQGRPDLKDKQDIFAIEKDSLELHSRLSEINVSVIVVGWQRPRTIDNAPIRSEYADRIVTLQFQSPNPQRRIAGSGTDIANVHFTAFTPLREFFADEFGIERDVMDTVIDAVEHNRR